MVIENRQQAGNRQLMKPTGLPHGHFVSDCPGLPVVHPFRAPTGSDLKFGGARQHLHYSFKAGAAVAGGGVPVTRIHAGKRPLPTRHFRATPQHAAVIKRRNTMRACPNLRPISHTLDLYASVGRRLKTAAGTMLRRITTSGRFSVPNVATWTAPRTASTNRRNFSAVPMTANMLPTEPRSTTQSSTRLRNLS